MADKIFLNSHFAFRCDTLENWQRVNPVLENGEPSVVSDGNENEWLKIGDGVTPWNHLPFKTGWINGLYNSIFNNQKFNDENNIVGYKGYKMIGYTLINDGKAVEIELRDAELKEKAVGNYVVGDLVNIDASTHLYQHQKITDITTNDAGNSVLTLVEVDGGTISFKLEALPNNPSEEDVEDFERIENWLWVVGRLYGEDIPMLSHAVASGFNTKAIGWGALTTGRNNEVYGNYGTALGRNNLAAFSALASGLGTKAIGIHSFTNGIYTTALGADSVALGANTVASGNRSLVGGNGAKALGEGSLAYGLRTLAKVSYSTSLGIDTEASGVGALAVGLNTKAYGKNSITMGNNTITGAFDESGEYILNTGLNALAQGVNTQASGENAVALGSGTKAIGGNTLVIGYATKANGGSSFAGGSGSTADKEGAFAFGLRVFANSNYQTVVGKDNDKDSNALFIVGNGTSSAKSNAFKVNSNGTATVAKDPINNMDVATKQYVDRLESEIEVLKQAIINLGGKI